MLKAIVSWALEMRVLVVAPNCVDPLMSIRKSEVSASTTPLKVGVAAPPSGPSGSAFDPNWLWICVAGTQSSITNWLVAGSSVPSSLNRTRKALLSPFGSSGALAGLAGLPAFTSSPANRAWMRSSRPQARPSANSRSMVSGVTRCRVKS